jgi:hypothetical protein
VTDTAVIGPCCQRSHVILKQSFGFKPGAS